MVATVEATGATAYISSQSNVRVVRSVDPAIYRQGNQIGASLAALL